MKDTGIIRRIDELGRIVIPKEMRKTLRLNVGTQMEIYTNPTGELILKKYSAISDIKDYAQIFCQALAEGGEKGVLICDTDTVLACNNVSKKDYLNKAISLDLEKLIFERKNYLLNVNENATTYPLVENDKTTYYSQIIVPIIVSSDIVGAIVLLSSNKDLIFTTNDVKIVQTVANILNKMLE